MITYSFNDVNIFCIKFFGDITFEEIENFLSKFKTLSNLPQNLILLYDFSEANLSIKPDDVKVISTLADEATINYKSVKTAFLVDKPLETAFSVLFSQIKNNKKKARKVFITESAAVHWLLENPI